jgi:hypothetical protein
MARTTAKVADQGRDQGHHWRDGLPVPVSRLLSPGTVTTDWATAQPVTGAYDVAYDIWFNRAPSTSGQPDLLLDGERDHLGAGSRYRPIRR